MIALIALGYVTSEQKNLAIGLLTLAVGMNAATYLGFQVSYQLLGINWINCFNSYNFSYVNSATTST